MCERKERLRRDDRAGRRQGAPTSRGEAAMSAPNKKRPGNKPGLRVFQGDLDVIEVRRRLSIEAGSVPEPPPRAHQQSGPRSPWFANFALSVGVLSVIFWGVIEGMHSKGAYLVLPGPDNAIPLTATAPVTTGSGARPATPVLLGVHDRQASMNEPMALGAILHGAGQEAIHIGGLNEGSRLPAGEKLGPTRWRVPAREVAGVLVLPPMSFVGVMNAVIQVWSPGNVTLDTQYARFEWVATTAAGAVPAKQSPEREDQSLPPATKLDPERVAWLIRRGA